MAKVHIFSKVVLSGDKIEVYEYSKPIVAGISRRLDVVRESDGEEVKRDDNLYRARQTLRRTIWANRCDNMKFLTLTYRDTVLDVKRVSRDITTFVQAMRRKGYPMDYVYVLEHQKDRGALEGNDGCLHVHFILFSSQKINLDDLNSAWPHGYTDIRKVRGVRDYGAYVSKYISKETFAEFGQHTYRTSLGLNKPEVINFYCEGFADGFRVCDGNMPTDFHPRDILSRFVPSYISKLRKDYRDEYGVGQTMSVTYTQGVLTPALRDWIDEYRISGDTEDQDDVYI